jgi:YgiT-type zinc finger domain-containing protein
MGAGLEDAEGRIIMRCRVCGRTLRATTTDLPFKVGDQRIVILKNLPVSQCDGCAEYLIADRVFAKVEQLLATVDTSVELEIIQFAA